MTQIEQAKAAKDFSDFWNGRGDEKQESQRFWIQLLQNVLGLADPAACIEFEKPVQLTHTSYVDAYIAGTKVLIEQKGVKVDLHRAYEQSDGTVLTPYQQAKRYADEMPNSLRPRWIVVCNFAEFLIYDLELPHGEPQQIFLKDLEKEYYRLAFLIDRKNENIRREEELSVAAGRLVEKLYDTLYEEYIPPENAAELATEANSRGLSPFQLRSLNILCVRIVFCLYAEDAGLFAERTSFEDYIRSFNLPNARAGLMKLFQALDTPAGERDQYEEGLKPFPYVNGGLFKDEQIEIPAFTQEIVDVIVNHCAPFNWSEISPTIFGAVFESTLNPETRRKGGMHYTSIQNIHKVIDPLFMDELNEEFEAVCAVKSGKQKAEKLLAFQKKLGGLTFLDPACGSGNFLTETYISLRRLENRVISVLNKGERVFGFDDYIKVHISQFYGIEINDFAVTVAKTALWIAESQMVAETEAIISQTIDFLPLKTGANIVEGNALRYDWRYLQSYLSNENFAAQNSRDGTQQEMGYLFADKLNIYDAEDFADGSLEVRTPEVDAATLYGKHFKELNVIQRTSEHKKPVLSKTNPVVYDYIIGNPPFVGARWMDKGPGDKHQKEDVILTFGTDWQGVGDLDYVCCWYKKALDLIRGKTTRCAFVSTNSIVQGSSVANLWKPLFEEGLHIDFAWRTFKWENETPDKGNMAAVHCVIIGFSTAENEKPKIIFTGGGQKVAAKNINGYLMDMPNFFIGSRQHPLCGVPEIGIGNKPIDGGFYLFAEREMQEFIKKEPASAQYFHEWIGSEEFIKGNRRYCLWLGDLSPAELLKMPECMKRVQAVREYRLKSTSAPTVKLADRPTRFHVENFPKGNYIVIPEVSSERRKYIPIGFLTPDIFCSNLVKIVPDATLYHFGVLTSSVHNAWMRTVCGRLKSDYRYSKDVVYNNFPWPSPSDEQKAAIEKTAQAILDTRAKYADCTMAQLYGETAYLFPELVKAHEANDKAVMAAYGFDMKMSESECVAELFRMYEKLVTQAQ